jgi:hypothetical protein
MVKRSEQPSEGEVVDTALNVDKLAGSFLEAMEAIVGKAGLLPKEVPALPSEGYVVTLKTNLTFGEKVWPIGSVIDLSQPGAVESDEHENAFIRAVVNGEEWTEQLAHYFPPKSDLKEIEAFSYQLYLQWIEELNAQADMTKLEDMLKQVPSNLLDQREVPAISIGKQLPERVVPIGWGKISGE